MERVLAGNHKPVQISYTSGMLENAKTHAKTINGKTHLKNSFTQGKNCWAGCLGEEIISTWVNGTIMDDYQYDVLTPKGKRLEVKTKLTTAEQCHPYYEGTVCDYNSTQNCDYYVFVRVNLTGTAWICGMISKDEFKKKATFFKKGDIDTRNGYKVNADCHNIYYGDLQPVPAFDKKLI